MIKVFLMDVDGTMTDGGRYMDSEGREQKRFYIPDGSALLALKAMGIQTGIMTAEKGPVVESRARQLKLDHVVLACKDKLQATKELCRTIGCELSDVAFIGDDFNDFDVMMAVGFKACPADAQATVKRIPGIQILKRNGGFGAVREFAENIVGEEPLFAAWRKQNASH